MIRSLLLIRSDLSYQFLFEMSFSDFFVGGCISSDTVLLIRSCTSDLHAIQFGLFPGKFSLCKSLGEGEGGGVFGKEGSTQGRLVKLGEMHRFFHFSSPKTLSQFVTQSMQSLVKRGDMQRFFARGNLGNTQGALKVGVGWQNAR